MSDVDEVELLRIRKGDLTADDAATMHEVVGDVERHGARRPYKPDGELVHAGWTASLER